MASTEEQLRDQARQAHAAGDAAAAARFMERAREASASASSIPVSEGSTLLKQYEDGGYITQNRKTRQMEYINPNDAYVTADQGTVTSIMREGGNSHKVRKGEMSRDVVGEGFTSIASMFGKGPAVCPRICRTSYGRRQSQHKRGDDQERHWLSRSGAASVNWLGSHGDRRGGRDRVWRRQG